MKIMVLGDVHGDEAWTSGMIFSAGDRGIDTIVQVGDWGSGFRGWHKFADLVSKVSVKKNVNFYFIDGNHDSTAAILADSELTKDGFYKLRENLFYIPRGHTWTWDGIKFMGIGGAVSIDKAYRMGVEGGFSVPEWDYIPFAYGKGTGPETLWWPTEQITDADQAAAMAVGKVDVLFTHDCPPEFISYTDFEGKADMDSELHRQRVAQIGRAVKPTVWFHGHMHTLANYSFMHEDGYADVYGLGCNGMGGRAAAEFDTTTLKV